MQIIKINPSDNVAVALEPIEKGNKIELDGENIKARNRIPAGHKVAIKDIKENEPVIKYGCRIGFASADIFFTCRYLVVYLCFLPAFGYSHLFRVGFGFGLGLGLGLLILIYIYLYLFIFILRHLKADAAYSLS